MVVQDHIGCVRDQTFVGLFWCWMLILKDPRADQKGSGRYPGRSCITNTRSIPATLGFLYSGTDALIQRGKLDPLRRSCKVSDPFIHLRRPFTISSPLHIRGYQISSPCRHPVILDFARTVNSGNRRRPGDGMIIDIVLPSRRNVLVFQIEWP